MTMISIIYSTIFLMTFIVHYHCSIVKEYSDKTNFTIDDNNRLTTNYLLYPNTPLCIEMFSNIDLDHRDTISISSFMHEQYFETGLIAYQCSTVCLQKGTHIDSIFDPLPQYIFHFVDNYPQAQIKAILTNQCQKMEVGFLSYLDNVADIYWIDSDNNRKKVGVLERGEKNTVWQTSYLGHEFVVVEQGSNKDVLNLLVTHDSINPIGSPRSALQKRYIKEQVRNTFNQEWQRANAVTRTFTEFGFNKGRLPADLWASISAYYYNNQHKKVLEEWGGKGVYVNWWEVEVYVIPMPWELKRYWQSRLKTLVEEWSGTELELTDIYGMRRYEQGARLLAHVDREETHAASLIINVAQGFINKPWKIEVFDFAHRLHEISMEPGDIVYYESARCLHGRMQPLEGEFYVNLFAHYRPVGDSQWHIRVNPVDAPVPVLNELGTCSTNNPSESTGVANLVTCTSGMNTPYLSPSLLRLKSPEDLFSMWLNIGEEIINKNKNIHLKDEL